MQPKLATCTAGSIGCTAVVVSGLIAIALLSQCGGGAGSQPRVPTLAITTPTLPNGVTGTSYNQTIQATGGVAPFVGNLSSGALPHNLSLAASIANAVTISGTPDTGAQGVAFTIQVTDSDLQVATASYTVSTCRAPTWRQVLRGDHGENQFPGECAL